MGCVMKNVIDRIIRLFGLYDGNDLIDGGNTYRRTEEIRQDDHVEGDRNGRQSGGKVNKSELVFGIINKPNY